MAIPRKLCFGPGPTPCHLGVPCVVPAPPHAGAWSWCCWRASGPAPQGEPSRAVRAPAPSPRPGPHGANPSCPRVSGRAELPQPGERVFVALGRWTIPAPTCRVPGTGVRAGALQLGMPRDTWECWGSARARLWRGARCGRADGGHRAWLRQQCHLVARPLPARLAAFPCSRRREGGVPQSARLGTFLD